MRIRNNNEFVFLLAIIVGVLVAFYSRIYHGGYVYPNAGSESDLQQVGVSELFRVVNWPR